MLKWFADDTQLRTTKEHKKPNVFLFGGIIIDSFEEEKLRIMMKDVKSKYTYPDLPVKWNFKDLKKVYEKFQKIDDYEKMLSDSYIWRNEIFDRSKGIDFKIVISALENFQYEKDNLKQIKGDLNCILFSNSLMRLGLYAQRVECEEFQVILDWPENSDPTPFSKEYYYAFNRGKSKDEISFHSGKLSDLGFQESVLFTKMTHSNSLQFADLIMGSFKDFIETNLHGHECSLGTELIKKVKTKFDGFPDSIIGVGVNVPSKNRNLKSNLTKIINKYVP